MKKLFLIVLSLAMVVCFASCNKKNTTNKFIDLKENQILTVGEDSTKYMNYVKQEEIITSKAYVIYEKHTLMRTYYQIEDLKYVLYNDYYYYWETETHEEIEELGKVTINTTYKYSYLPYGKEENLAVKEVKTTTYDYDYEGGFVDKTAQVVFDLNGYFASFEELETLCPDLAAKINTETTRTYYIDATTNDTIETKVNTYNTYYYIDEK